MQTPDALSDCGVQTASIDHDMLKDMMNRAVNNVFSTMLSRQAEAVDASTFKRSDGEACPLQYFHEDCKVLVGMVGFLGRVNGMVYLYLEESLARSLVGCLLGMTDEEVAAEGTGMVNDGLGEICNMTVGAFKQQLCAMGYDCSLTIPSIICGSHFSIETSADVTRCSAPFKTGDQLFVTDILLKIENN
jgi:chemotaxis protein CheX